MSLSFPHDTHTAKNRLEGVFQFLRAFQDLRLPCVTDVRTSPLFLWFHDLPPHQNIEHVYQETMVAQPEAAEDTMILRVTRPILQPCPPPPTIIQEWLIPDWQDPKKDGQTLEQRTVKNAELSVLERFEEDEERVQAHKHWQEIRRVWQEQERPALASMEIFQTLYKIYEALEREGEQVELLVGDGILTDPANPSLHYPILCCRVELEFFPGREQPQFVLRRREHPPELMTDLLRSLPNANIQQLNACVQELEAGEFDPLAQGDTEDFLRRVIQGLFPPYGTLTGAGTSSSHITLTRDPLLFIRPRSIGLSQRIEAALQDITHRLTSHEAFPPALMQLLDMEHVPDQIPETTSSEGSDQKARTQSVLFSLPANPEQLQIAVRMQQAGGVVVQGPPGTGKTHTIANLIGHLLAQGKRILVTAQTPKALRVLREKIVPSLQPLCVSVLQKDRQNREELQQAIKSIHQRLASDPNQLLQEAASLRERRTTLLEQEGALRTALLRAREDETREIVVNGQSFRPTEAAKIVAAGKGQDDWIPGPLNAGEPLPLSATDIAELYHMHADLSLQEERELHLTRPALDALPSPEEFLTVIQARTQHEIQETQVRTEYWEKDTTPSEEELVQLLQSVSLAHQFLDQATLWQQQIIQAGRDGHASQRLWTSLTELIENAWRDIQDSKQLVIEYGPVIESPLSTSEALALTEEIVLFLESGHTLDWKTRLTKRTWHSFAERICINNRALDIQNKEEWKAVRGWLRIAAHRESLRRRWQRQMNTPDSPSLETLDEQPERTCREYVPHIEASLRWHETVWIPLEQALIKIGFDWHTYFQSVEPKAAAEGPLARLQAALFGELRPILEARLRQARFQKQESQLLAWQEVLGPTSEQDSETLQHLRTAILERNGERYQQAYLTLQRLEELERLHTKRGDLLTLLGYAAPLWAQAIQHRLPGHDQSTPPGNPEKAWVWRQLSEELERRATTSLEYLQTSIESLHEQLQQITGELIEKQTWAYQIQHVTTEQRKALGAYSTLQTKLTKSGQGKREPEIRAAIRKEMETAKYAVPVWIMPLSEVIETFDPRSTRFDIVIVDEASQCDTLALFALYLGQQCIIVGDDEQVTPLSVGVEAERVTRLAQTYLGHLPHKELYDGETSLYELARISFGHVVRLVEHFRCAPDIIAFSNALCYQGEIKPLREETSILLKPSCVPYRVVPQNQEHGSINLTEAQAITSLICAAIEQPEYAQNSRHLPLSFGVSCLVGEQQAHKIQELLHEKLAPEIYEQRRILCGTPAHFQGDERDVMFLSMVDQPHAGPLPLRDAEAQKRVFKKRYNVATSRARDQLWLIYSLQADVDLKPQDIRRRLIEHVQDPHAWKRILEQTLTKTESVFEERVCQQLLSYGYHVTPQFMVGAYRIDLVVQGTHGRLAIECDGEAWHTHEQLEQDLERQAMLERLGWTFIHIRGSVFFRDPERALQPVLERLQELGISPQPITHPLTTSASSTELMERVTRRASVLRQEWGWK